MKRFAITGVAGFVAPRHLEAIKACGGEVVAALDPHDSVGILDRYSKHAAFFTETERFERHLDKLSRTAKAVDYLVVCSPNYLHDAHVRMGLQTGCNVICEKPLALNPENLDALQRLERETGRRVHTVLQLRAHPAIETIKKRLQASVCKDPQQSIHHAHLNYCTPRGSWYDHSWKGDVAKSGGIITNIGIHMFDLLLTIFGPSVGHAYTNTEMPHSVRGVLYCGDTTVTWRLSIVADEKPVRSLDVQFNDATTLSVEFSDGFQDAHTKVYQEILAGGGCGIDDARPAIELCWRLRQQLEGVS